MSSRINIARPQPANSYNVDPNGLGNSRGFGGGPYQSSSPAPNPDDPFLKIKQIASKIEDLIDIYSQPLRPHLGSIGRFLIVVTFLEDSWRITTQWSDQCWYLEKYGPMSDFRAFPDCLGDNRHRHFPKFFSNLFLFLNVIVCCIFSLTRWHF